MKVLKWILYVLLAIAALVLIVPIFMPSTTTISAETEIAASPEQVFHVVSQFKDRDQWDPWLEQDPEAEVVITPNEDYIGSTYKWNGEVIGSGLMRIEEVKYGEKIIASIWFGEDADSSVVEWDLEDSQTGTHVTWSFIADGKYPFGRLMLSLMSGGMSSSFESGLESFKSMLEANPPELYATGEIAVSNWPEMHSLVMPAEGSMEEITGQFERIFTEIFTYMGSNGIQPSGPAFAYYYDYDMETGLSKALIGAQLIEPDKGTGDMISKTFKAGKAVTVEHHGHYDFFQKTYDAVTVYIEENNLEVTGGAFEIYQKTMMDTDNTMEWSTLIAFPLK